MYIRTIYINMRYQDVSLYYFTPQAQEYNYGLRSGMSSHAHVVSRLSVHVLLIFAAKSVRARMIHIYVCSVQCVHVLSVRTCTSPPPPLSLFGYSIKKDKVDNDFIIFQGGLSRNWPISAQMVLNYVMCESGMERRRIILQ